MINAIATAALGAARVLPAIEMLRDFSEAAEAEAKAGAQALFGLGLCCGAGASLLIGSICLFALSHPIFGGAFLALCAPCGWAGHLCKRRLDQTRSKLEQLRGAALAARAAKALGSKASELASAAVSAGSSIPGAAQSGGRAAIEAAAAAASALSDPATRQAAADLASEAFHGLMRGAGFAAGWLKSHKAPAAIAAPAQPPELPAPAEPAEQAAPEAGER